MLLCLNPNELSLYGTTPSAYYIAHSHQRFHTAMKNLPISIQTLAKIRENDSVFVDKTEMVAQLVKRAGAYFLSRPRRFGKSLLLDTFKELFEGNRALFQGLYIEDKWDWDLTRPVVKIDFANGAFQSNESLDSWLHQQLDENQKALNLDIEGHSIASIRFSRLIEAAAKQFQQPNPALEQIKQRGYADKYQGSGKTVFQVGMIFNTQNRNLVQMDWA